MLSIALHLRSSLPLQHSQGQLYGFGIDHPALDVSAPPGASTTEEIRVSCSHMEHAGERNIQ